MVRKGQFARSLLPLFIGLGFAVLGVVSAQSQVSPITPTPIPAQAPAKEAVAPLPGTQLWYWDTGGPGIPIVLLHPATGSGLIWGYQQPVHRLAGSSTPSAPDTTTGHDVSQGGVSLRRITEQYFQ